MTLESFPASSLFKNGHPTQTQSERGYLHKTYYLPSPTVACSRKRPDLHGIEEQHSDKVMSDLNGKALTSMDNFYQSWWKPEGTVAGKALLRVP